MPKYSQTEADELFDAIRQHWRIEVMHYQRDVTLSEDALKTSNASVSRLRSEERRVGKECGQMG